MNQMAISVRSLVRKFGKITALNGMDFDVPKGSVTGLLGPNGAGKSTAIHILMGLLRRDAGDVTVMGADPVSGDVEIKKRTGFVPEDPRGEPRFTVRQNLNFLKAFRPTWDDQLEQELLKMFEMDPTKRSQTLSRGQRAKLGLIGALSFRPELLILDDPTSGLDPLARREFIEGIVSVLAEEGRTVFFSSHQVDDIERVADRIVMIYSGKNIYQSTMEELHRNWRQFRLSFKDKPAPQELVLPGLRRWESSGHAGRAVFDRYDSRSESALMETQAQVESQPFSLEDIYIELVRYRNVGG
jgi:ABC-2 type transport system ATP-binding protein